MSTARPSGGPEVSVLLTSWNTRDEIRGCLRALHAAAAGLTYEVIAVDNGSVDGSTELLAADPRVNLIRNERNVGFAAAINQAHRRATGEFVLLLNSDVCFHLGALHSMVRFLRRRPEAAGVSPLYVNPDGTFQQAYCREPSFITCFALFTSLRRLPGFRGSLHQFDMRGEDFSQPRELSSGSCLLLRAGVVATDHLLDERFPVYWNDNVLTRQLRDAGERLWMIPEAVVTHNRGASCRLMGPAMRFRHLLGGMVCYLTLTQPRHRVALFRMVLLAEYLLKSVCGRKTTLGWSDLTAALRGDVGPLPDGDTREWAVIVGAQADQGGTSPNAGTADSRTLLVHSCGAARRSNFTVRQIGTSQWETTLPTALPFGDRIPVFHWINSRIAAAKLRRWLDRQSGTHTLQIDARHYRLSNWLGQDIPIGSHQSTGRR